MKFPTRRLGIDLGTANTLVFVPGKGVVLEEPSVVAVTEIDNRIVAVGREAKEMIGRTPESVIAYRPLKDGVIADHRVTESMLRYFMTKAMGGFSFFRPDVMVSVPAGITSTERRAVVEAAIRAGAKSAVVVKEPILAAVGAGIDVQEAKGRIIVDIGGGTTDVAVISLGGIVCSISVKCAGNKIDQAILEHMRKVHNMVVGEQTAEEIKMTIGSAVTVPPQDELSMVVKGRDLMSGIPKSVTVHTNEIVKAIDAELRQIVKAVRAVLEQTPPELASDIIDNGIVMSGGTSMLKNFPALIERRTGGVKTRLAENAFYCVAQGTGIILDHLDAYKRSIYTKQRTF